MTASEELRHQVLEVNDAGILSATDGSPVVYGTIVEGAELLALPAHVAYIVGGKIGVATFEGVWILHPDGEIEPYDVRISTTFGQQRRVELHLHAICDLKGNFTRLKGIIAYQNPLDEENQQAGMMKGVFWRIHHLMVADVQTPKFWVQFLV